MTIYRVVLRPRAQRAWNKLNPSLIKQLKRKLDERRRNPRVPAARLSHLPGCYKIKLKAEGVRLVYQVREAELLILVLAIGTRERSEAYEEAKAELRRLDDRS